MTTLMDLELADLPVHQQAHYRQCLANGCTLQMALMLASRFAPVMGGSDRAFNEGARRKMNALPEVNCKMIELAQKAGINTHGKYHVAGLGACTDPMAWVSTIDDARDVIKKKGLSSRGLINYQAPERPPPEAVPLAPDLVDAEIRRRIATDEAVKRAFSSSPEKRASRLQELREQVIAEHGPQRRKSGRGGSLGQRLLTDVAGNS